MCAWFAMAVAAMMQSPMGMFLCRHFRRSVCLATVGVRFTICKPLAKSVS